MERSLAELESIVRNRICSVCTERTVDAHVRNLRKKIGSLADGTERIKGVRGIGYLYAVPAVTN